MLRSSVVSAQKIKISNPKQVASLPKPNRVALVPKLEKFLVPKFNKTTNEVSK